uniref:Uncharacterized protein n=1 Tax=Phlebotomus papatasi TaxID=29031 RepID=A0A1B0D3D0_PHLPP
KLFFPQSHTPSTEYWKTASVETQIQEFGDQRDTLAHFAQINRDDIVGVRVPHLQLSGNNSFEAIRRFGGLYDCSWPTQHFVGPGMWPFTLDYASTMDCTVGSCPTASIPGVWVVPMIGWIDTDGYKCAMVDTCPNLPADDVEETFEWMKENFERIYNSNRAPFGVFLHSAWFLTRPSNFPAYKKYV